MLLTPTNSLKHMWWAWYDCMLDAAFQGCMFSNDIPSAQNFSHGYVICF
jgi:hypothetical protein